MGIQERTAVKSAANERIKNIGFGDPITNVCAGEESPHRHAYFCRKVTKTKSTREVTHTDFFVECTDRKGNFWKTDFVVIFAGHLDSDTCKTLWGPIWAAHYS